MPEPGPDDVLIRVRSAGLSRGLLALWFFPGQIFPMTPGHEFAGVVERIGRDVGEVATGQRVRVRSSIPCGVCSQCLAAAPERCPELVTIGYACYGQAGRTTYETYHDGGLAEYAVVPASTVVPIPDLIGFDAACKIGTLAGAYRALRLAAPGDGLPLVVTGASGGSGSAVLAMAAGFGDRPVIAVAGHPDRLARAAKLCGLPVEPVATDDLDADWPARGLLTARLRELTGGGAGALIDHIPLGTDVTRQAVAALRPGGRAVLAGGNHGTLDLQYLQIMRNQLTITGLRGATRADEDAVTELVVGGELEPDQLITHRFGLAELDRAAEIVTGRQGGPAFVIVNP